MRIIAIICLAYSVISFAAIAQEEVREDEIKMAIIFPGGPAPEKVEKYIGQFVDNIAGEIGLGKGSFSGRYFTEQPSALDYLEKNRDSFIISSLGFYLYQRKALDLLPLARVELASGPAGRYFLVVKKGATGTLEELKGKTISGSTLYQDHRFLTRIVFNNLVDIGSDFILKPTPRPLSAIRKVLKGTLDGVLLDEVQFNSLKSLPFFEEIDVIYTSPQLPEVGLMMIDTPATRKLKDRLLQALLALGDSEDGAAAFEAFGMVGFKEIDQASLDAVIVKYEENGKKTD